ncbi:hypothetical protein [Thermosynechococcus sp. NK55a]|uniref:hypothetical protein n=1 Tax=Thermosynechococcus sp. NK55a TaxID=1394889 RepID=UPI0003FD272C|nr:hypothetical protein [Thermosynechococcus sp. NK55a]
MRKFTLSIFDPNFLLPHRAGIAGLALVLADLEPQRHQAPLTWQVTDESVELQWQGKDKDVVRWLLNRTYQINEPGYLNVPALKLDEQGQYSFTRGVLSTFLQHNKQRQFKEKTITRTFLIEPGEPEIRTEIKPLSECYYTEEEK